MVILIVWATCLQEGERKAVALEREGLVKESQQLSLAQKQCHAAQEAAERSKAQVSYIRSLGMIHVKCALLIVWKHDMLASDQGSIHSFVEL